MTSEVFTTISEGKLKDNTIERLVKTLPNGRYLVKFEDKTKHSSNQRAYYWACIIPEILYALREAGYNEFKTKDDVHTFLKYHFAPVEILDITTGEMVKIPGSTKKMTKARYREFIDDVMMFSSQKLSHFIPEPKNPEDKYDR
jgi:hypothetical protein